MQLQFKLESTISNFSLVIQDLATLALDFNGKSFFSPAANAYHAALSAVFQMTAQQIKQREQEYPDDVDEVPVKTRNLNRIVVFRTVAPARSKVQNYGKHAYADDHVNRMHARHGEVDPVEHLDMPRVGAGQKMDALWIKRPAGN